MKKLNLKIEDLEVKSFETAPARESRGTVHGADGRGSWSCSCLFFCVPKTMSDLCDSE